MSNLIRMAPERSGDFVVVGEAENCRDDVEDVTGSGRFPGYARPAPRPRS